MTSSRVENSSSRAARKVKLALMGPAFVAAIGYIDPGNFATNIQAGASFGYQLLWVVVWANLMAMLIQVLSAKLGIATGKNLAEQIRDHYPRPVVWFYWVQAEIIAMATDLAEFIGAAIGFKLVLGVSLLQGAVLTGVATFLILMLQRRGQKPLEKVIGGLLLFVAVAYVVELIFSQPALAPLTKGLVIPTLPNGEAVFLAAGVLGATIMPHVIYLHSSLTQHLHGGTRKERYNATRWDVAIAMTIAGFVNLAMMATAAAAFHFNGHTGVADLPAWPPRGSVWSRLTRRWIVSPSKRDLAAVLTCDACLRNSLTSLQVNIVNDFTVAKWRKVILFCHLRHNPSVLL